MNRDTFDWWVRMPPRGTSLASSKGISMSEIANRVRSNVSTVVLTLLGIIQALAFEQLWTHVLDADALYEVSWQALTTWIQVLATLLASILVWLVYAVNVIRFVWLPSIYEFILPFWVGFIQLLMVQFLAPIDIGGWFIIASVLFGTMIWISQSTMRKARLDRGNASFFTATAAASWSDFIPAFVMIGLFSGFGLYAVNVNTSHLINLMMLLVLVSYSGFQLRMLRIWWQRSLTVNETSASKSSEP
ncbi:MAG: hypothetical protein HN856_05170 [Gammaproteobacteria bacterium]|jgi:hypothetical protein|nr:hypothetical protein [Gammaproteobacteria bacterium]